MRDLDDAMRGLTATLAEPLVKSADGKQVCDTVGAGTNVLVFSRFEIA